MSPEKLQGSRPWSILLPSNSPFNVKSMMNNMLEEVNKGVNLAIGSHFRSIIRRVMGIRFVT